MSTTVYWKNFQLRTYALLRYEASACIIYLWNSGIYWYFFFVYSTFFKSFTSNLVALNGYFSHELRDGK